MFQLRTASIAFTLMITTASAASFGFWSPSSVAAERCYGVETNCSRAQTRARERVAALARVQQEYRTTSRTYATQLKDLQPLIDWFSQSREDELYNYRFLTPRDAREGVAIVAVPKGNLLKAYVALVSFAESAGESRPLESLVCESQPLQFPQPDLSRFLSSGTSDGCPAGYALYESETTGFLNRY
jgi:hypothetical protein